MAERRLPPDCGADLDKEFLYNPYQVRMLEARRLRICPRCAELGPCDGFGVFRCRHCGTVEGSQIIARKAFHRIGIVGGRRSGKTRVGAVAAREEVCVPKQLGWVIGPTFPILNDSTMPAFFRLLPPSWVKDWSAGSKELRLKNDHVIQFRSLDDPERGRGQGPAWAWVDEAQKLKEKAWDVFRPSLTENKANCIFTWTPNGFDWTWRRLYRPAFDLSPKYHQNGFWMAQCKTIDNPWIQKYGLEEVEEARRTMPAEMFRQEYEADFVSFSGNVYDWELIEKHIISEDDVAGFIPEYPYISPQRSAIVGLGGGVTHPFAGLLVVPTDRGLVVMNDYLHEHRSVAVHHDRITQQMINPRTAPNSAPLTLQWAADEDKKFIHKELGLMGVGVAATEHYLMSGVQRVQSWLYSGQLFFVGSACERVLEQMRGYRWNDTTNDDEHVEEDRDLLRDDELPKALHAACLSFPELPSAARRMLTARELALDDKTRGDIDRFRQCEHDGSRLDDAEGSDIRRGEASWPLGDFFGQSAE